MTGANPAGDDARTRDLVARSILEMDLQQPQSLVSV